MTVDCVPGGVAPSSSNGSLTTNVDAHRAAVVLEAMNRRNEEVVTVRDNIIMIRAEEEEEGTIELFAQIGYNSSRKQRTEKRKKASR